MLSSYKKLGVKLRKTPSMSDVDRESSQNPDFPTRGVLQMEFHSFRKLARMAGFKPNKEKRLWTESQMIRSMRKTLLELGTIPSHQKHVAQAKLKKCPYPSTIVERFGSLEAGFKKALSSGPNKELRTMLIKELEGKTESLAANRSLRKITLEEASTYVSSFMLKQGKIPSIPHIRSTLREQGISPSITYPMTSHKSGYYGFIADLISSNADLALQLQPLYELAVRLSQRMERTHNSCWDKTSTLDALTNAWIDCGGRTPKIDELRVLSRSDRCPSLNRIRSMFGSVENAFLLATENPLVKLCLLDRLLDFIHDAASYPTPSKWCTAASKGLIPDIGLIEQHVGPLSDLTQNVIDHGLDMSAAFDHTRSMSQRAVIKEIRNLYQISRVPPYIDKLPKELLEQTMLAFGSFHDAASAAGFPGYRF